MNRLPISQVVGEKQENLQTQDVGLIYFSSMQGATCLIWGLMAMVRRCTAPGFRDRRLPSRFALERSETVLWFPKSERLDNCWAFIANDVAL